MMKELLANAIAIASQAHKYQFDKLGEPYILHPIRVMQACSTDEEKIVAILHDLLEDTEWSKTALLLEGFPSEIVSAIVCLTRQEKESYKDFLDRVCTNRIAVKVKLCDVRDNLDPSRLKGLDSQTQTRLKAKYEPAITQLEAKRLEFEHEVHASDLIGE